MLFVAYVFAKDFRLDGNIKSNWAGGRGKLSNKAEMQRELPQANAEAQALAVYNTRLKYSFYTPLHHFFHTHLWYTNTNSWIKP